MIDGNAPERNGLEALEAEDPIEAPDAATSQRQLAAVKHGLYVRAPAGLKLRSKRIRMLKAKVRAALPWLQPSDEPAVSAWCELQLVTARLFADVLAKNDPGTIDLYRRTKALQLAYERELGMTPAARAELGLTTAQALHLSDPRERLAAAARSYKARQEQQGEK